MTTGTPHHQPEREICTVCKQERVCRRTDGKPVCRTCLDKARVQASANTDRQKAAAERRRIEQRDAEDDARTQAAFARLRQNRKEFAG